MAKQQVIIVDGPWPDPWEIGRKSGMSDKRIKELIDLVHRVHDERKEKERQERDRRNAKRRAAAAVKRVALNPGTTTQLSAKKK